jgi:DNA-binding transcriptional ArsR family regulator
MMTVNRELENALWRALADGTRRWMLDVLRQGPRTTGELAVLVQKDSGLSRCAVMKHLDVLEKAGLVVVRREGKFRWNHINAAPFVAMYRRWVSRFGSLPGAAFFELKNHVERTENGGKGHEGDRG